MRWVVVLLMAAACGEDRCPEWLKPNGADQCLVPGGAGTAAQPAAAGRSAVMTQAWVDDEDDAGKGGGGKHAEAGRGGGGSDACDHCGGGGASAGATGSVVAGAAGVATGGGSAGTGGSVAVSLAAECGNGKVEGDELCDGDCPTGCSDGDPCTTDELVGDACTRSCEHTKLPMAECWSSGNHTAVGRVVVDSVRKLVWQRQLSARYDACHGRVTETGLEGSACTWKEAGELCQSPEIAALGGTGWRLPTLAELQSTIDKDKTPILAVVFPRAPIQPFWTSTSVPQPAGYYMALSLEGGGALYFDGNQPLFVRCVRDSKQGEW